MGTANHATHEFGPIVRPDSEILILGSFPSVKSREVSFYYGHPQNRFWRVMEQIFECEPLQTIEDKRNFCFLHHIAIYDVIEECDIIGSSDASIKNPIPSNLFEIVRGTNIKKVVLNGKKAEKIFLQFFPKGIGEGIEVVSAPSTSPANAAWGLNLLIQVWKGLLS